MTDPTDPSSPIQWTLQSSFFQTTLKLDETISLVAHRRLGFEAPEKFIKFKLDNKITYVKREDYCKAMAQKINPKDQESTLKKITQIVDQLDLIITMKKNRDMVAKDLNEFSNSVLSETKKPRENVKNNKKHVRFQASELDRNSPISSKTSSETDETTSSDNSEMESHDKDILLEVYSARPKTSEFPVNLKHSNFQKAQKDFEKAFEDTFLTETKNNLHIHDLLTEKKFFIGNVLIGLIADFIGKQEEISTIDALETYLIDGITKNKEISNYSSALKQAIKATLKDPIVKTAFAQMKNSSVP